MMQQILAHDTDTAVADCIGAVVYRSNGGSCKEQSVRNDRANDRVWVGAAALAMTGGIWDYAVIPVWTIERRLPVEADVGAFTRATPLNEQD